MQDKLYWHEVRKCKILFKWPAFERKVSLKTDKLSLNHNLYRCSCHYGWTSDFCNKVVCHEGSPDESGINCTCKPKHRGRFCDFCTESESTPFPECAKIVRDSVNLPKEIFIAAGAILIIICIGLFILAVILRRMRRKSRRRHNSSDSYDFEKRYQLMNRANDRLPYEN